MAILVEYDGTDFVGWQFQAEGRSVQKTLEQAIHAAFGEKARVIGAGRTDSGVHARGQVAHFDLRHPISPANLPSALNTRLPADVRVLAAAAVPRKFNARGDARLRRYVYDLATGYPRPALGRQLLGWTKFALDTSAMASAAKKWVGRHDFASFQAAGCVAPTSRLTLKRFDVESTITNPGGREIVRFTIESRSFLRQQIRIMVGTLMMIGRGARSAQWAEQVLAERARGIAGPPAPPEGLTLEEVQYEKDLWKMRNAECGMRNGWAGISHSKP